MKLKIIRLFLDFFKNIKYRALKVTIGKEGLKGYYELSFWNNLYKTHKNSLPNKWYARWFTDYFDIPASFYNDKTILDIGCGPCGSLEWAKTARIRVGVDPLASSYRKLGSQDHQMAYVTARSESLPFASNSFDIVTSFNSLDHVNNLDLTISEIIRMVKPGGLFLFISDVNHEPTNCEPISYSWDILRKFTPTLTLMHSRQFEKSSLEQGVYQAIELAVPFDENNQSMRCGVLTAKFLKKQSFGTKLE